MIKIIKESRTGRPAGRFFFCLKIRLNSKLDGLNDSNSLFFSWTKFIHFVLKGSFSWLKSLSIPWNLFTQIINPNGHPLFKHRFNSISNTIRSNNSFAIIRCVCMIQMADQAYPTDQTRPNWHPCPPQIIICTWITLASVFHPHLAFYSPCGLRPHGETSPIEGVSPLPGKQGKALLACRVTRRPEHRERYGRGGHRVSRSRCRAPRDPRPEARTTEGGVCTHTPFRGGVCTRRLREWGPRAWGPSSLTNWCLKFKWILDIVFSRGRAGRRRQAGRRSCWSRSQLLKPIQPFSQPAFSSRARASGVRLRRAVRWGRELPGYLASGPFIWVRPVDLALDNPNSSSAGQGPPRTFNTESPLLTGKFSYKIR